MKYLTTTKLNTTTAATTFHYWYLNTIRTCLILLIGSILTNSAIASIQDGVIVKKVGNSYMFVFPGSFGRIKGINNPAGRISVGQNITVLYSLEIIHGRARFIAMDSTPIKPLLKVEQADKLFGFIVRDTRQGTLDMIIKPSFMANVEHHLGATQERISRQGNLDVVFGTVDGKVKILRVILD